MVFRVPWGIISINTISWKRKKALLVPVIAHINLNSKALASIFLISLFIVYFIGASQMCSSLSRMSNCSSWRKETTFKTPKNCSDSFSAWDSWTDWVFCSDACEYITGRSQEVTFDSGAYVARTKLSALYVFGTNAALDWVLQELISVKRLYSMSERCSEAIDARIDFIARSRSRNQCKTMGVCCKLFLIKHLGIYFHSGSSHLLYRC